MHVPFLKLAVDDKEQTQLLAAIQKVLTHGKFILGPEHNLLEQEIASFCGRRYCVAVGSGTDALFLTCKVLGLSEGDEVITTPLSWVASTHSFTMHGATPVFADIDETLNIDPIQVEQLITDKTAAILAVDYAGHPANYKQLTDIAEKYQIPLIEDGSQAFGASIQNRKVGNFGSISCISMNPMKPLCALGEAGVILTDDVNLYNKLIAARYSGMVNRETCYEASINCRMDTLQAAILLERLKNYPQVMDRRQEIADRYREALAAHVDFPSIHPEVDHAYYLFLIFSEQREELFNFLNEQGIEARIRDNILISSQPCYQAFDSDRLIYSKHASNHLLALPAHEKMSNAQVEYVIQKVKEFFEGTK